jgi:hypothetical protein
VVRALATKGITPPDPALSRMTRDKLREAFGQFQPRSVMQTMGHGNETRYELVLLHSDFDRLNCAGGNL